VPSSGSSIPIKSLSFWYAVTSQRLESSDVVAAKVSSVHTSGKMCWVKIEMIFKILVF
jgi:hypothetical protein